MLLSIAVRSLTVAATLTVLSLASGISLATEIGATVVVAPSMKVRPEGALASRAQRTLVAQAGQELTVDNLTGVDIDILYADGTNDFVVHDRLRSGFRIALPSQAGFIWYFGANGAIFKRYEMTAQSGQYLEIDDTMLAQAGGAAPTPVPNQTLQQQLAPEVQLTLDNTTGVAVDILYADQAGRYAVYQTIPTDSRVVLTSPPGFTWYFGVGGTAVIGEYQVATDEGQYIVLDTDTIVQAGLGAPAASRDAIPSAGGNGMAVLPPVTAPIPTQVDFNGPRVDVAALPLQQPSAGTTSLRPRPNWVRPSWEQGTSETKILFAPGAGGILRVGTDGQLETGGFEDSTSSAHWYTEQIPQTGEFYIRSARDTSMYLYVPEGAAAGTPVAFGPAGTDSAAARWRAEPGGPGGSVVYSVARPDLMLVAEGGQIGVAAAVPAAQTNVRQIWLEDNVQNWLDLRGLVTQLGQNIADLDAEYAASLAQAEADAAAAAEAERVALLAFPYSATDPADPGYFWVHPGQLPVEQKSANLRGITYDFSRVNFPDIHQPLYQNIETRNQSVHLNFVPEAFVFVRNGVAYARLKTSSPTGIELRSDGLPSSRQETDSTYYLSAVNLSVWADAGQIEVWSPANANTSTGSGSSSDTSMGLNLSPQDFGGDLSQSRGSSIDRQVDDYQVTGYSDRNGASYDWTGCGLAETTVVTDNCLYRDATDMFDEATFSLRAIKPVATSMTLMQTDSTFRLGPVESLPDTINLAVYISARLDAVSIRTADRTIGSQLVADMERAFSIFWTTEAWERAFEGAELKQRRSSQEAVTFSDTAGFKVIVELDISQLKQG